MVGAVASQAGTPVVVGRCEQDSGHGGTQAEDRSPRRGAAVVCAGREAISADLGAESGAAGFAAAAGASPQAGGDEAGSQEPVATSSPEPGSAAEVQAVDGDR